MEFAELRGHLTTPDNPKTGEHIHDFLVTGGVEQFMFHLDYITQHMGWSPVTRAYDNASGVWMQRNDRWVWDAKVDAGSEEAFFSSVEIRIYEWYIAGSPIPAGARATLHSPLLSAFSGYNRGSTGLGPADKPRNPGIVFGFFPGMMWASSKKDWMLFATLFIQGYQWLDKGFDWASLPVPA